MDEVGICQDESWVSPETIGGRGGTKRNSLELRLGFTPGAWGTHGSPSATCREGLLTPSGSPGCLLQLWWICISVYMECWPDLQLSLNVHVFWGWSCPATCICRLPDIYKIYIIFNEMTFIYIINDLCTYSPWPFLGIRSQNVMTSGVCAQTQTSQLQPAVTSLPSPKGPANAIWHYYETYAVKHTYTGQLRQHQKARQYPGNERKAKTSYVNAYEKEFGATGPPAFEDTCSR